jgi:hypothetical protein
VVDHTSLHLALRVKLLTLSMATTGSVSLSATATGYARTVGNFYTDGFWPGMEVKTSGFANPANNGRGVIQQVTPLAMVVTMYVVTTSPADGSRKVSYPPNVAEAAAAGRLMSVGLPSNGAWENSTYIPITGVPYIEEQYIPGPGFIANDGYAGLLELRPMYSPRVYVPLDTGISADGRYADAITRLFLPGTTLPLATGDQFVVRGDVAPMRGQRAPSATRAG